MDTENWKKEEDGMLKVATDEFSGNGSNLPPLMEMEEQATSSNWPAKLKIRPQPVETWLEVISFVDRKALAESVSVCPLLHAPAYTRLHKDGPCRVLPFLMFTRSTDDYMSARLRKSTGTGGLSHRSERKWKQITIATCEPSANIVSFGRIEISFFDGKVFAFLEAIRETLLHDIHLEIGGVEKVGLEGYRICRGTLTVLGQLEPLLMGRVRSLMLRSEFFLTVLDRFTALFKSIRLIELDILREPIIPALIQWLCTPLEQDQKQEGNHTSPPKFLVVVESQDNLSTRDNFVTQLKQSFLSANNGVSFFIRLCSEFSTDKIEELAEEEEDEDADDDDEVEGGESEGNEDDGEEEESNEVEEMNYFAKYNNEKGNEEETAEEDESDEDEPEDEEDSQSEDDDDDPPETVDIHYFCLDNSRSGERMELRRQKVSGWPPHELMLARWPTAASKQWLEECETELGQWMVYGNRLSTLYIGNCELDTDISRQVGRSCGSVCSTKNGRKRINDIGGQNSQDYITFPVALSSSEKQDGESPAKHARKHPQ